MSEWTLARSLVALRREADALWPDRAGPDGTIGDTAHSARPSDHNPDARGVVRAIDISSSPTPDGDVADIIVTHIRQRRDPRVTYIIWQRRICNARSIGGAAPWAWRPYGGANPHTRHAHISVAGAPHGDDGSPWHLEEAVMPTAQEIADAILATPITRAWDGERASVATILSGAHYYALSGAVSGVVPAGATSGPGRPTAYQRLLTAISAVGTPIVDVEALADAIVRRQPGVGAADVRAAIREVLGSLDEVPPPAVSGL